MLLRSECGDRERDTFKDAVTSRGKREEEIAEKTEKNGRKKKRRVLDSKGRKHVKKKKWSPVLSSEY